MQKALDYGVFKDVPGFVRIYKKDKKNVLNYKPDTGFEVILYNNKKILFNVHTGKEIITSENIFTRKK